MRRSFFERQEKLEQKLERFEEDKEDLQKKRDNYVQKLEQTSGLTREEARKALLDETERDSASMIARIIKEKEEEAKATGDQKAREILVDSMRHGALDYIAEYTVTVVRVPDEEMKGRIIGKEGRNIRAFEQATGVDVDLDEEGIIRLSSFDSVRREVARQSLEKLLKDTRIQPFRIEEIVDQDA